MHAAHIIHWRVYPRNMITPQWTGDAGQAIVGAVTDSHFSKDDDQTTLSGKKLFSFLWQANIHNVVRSVEVSKEICLLMDKFI